MKKITVSLAVVALILSFGIANAGDGSKIPQSFQDQYMAATGTQATSVIWLPFVPELTSYTWSTFVVISNFNNFATSVQCQYTNYSNEQTTKTYTIPFYGKKIVVVGTEIGKETVYDVYCYSSNLFGLSGLLLEGTSVATALQTMWIQ